MGRFARCLQRELQHVPATDLGGSRSCTAANTVQPVTVKSDVQKVPSGRHVRSLDVSWRGQGLELVYLCILQAPVCRWQNGSATKGRVGPNEGLMSSPIVKASVELLLLHWKRRSKKFGRLGCWGDILPPCTFSVRVGSPEALPLPSKFFSSIPRARGCMYNWGFVAKILALCAPKPNRNRETVMEEKERTTLLFCQEAKQEHNRLAGEVIQSGSNMW